MFPMQIMEQLAKRAVAAIVKNNSRGSNQFDEDVPKHGV
jgi:hypothetical protein